MLLKIPFHFIDSGLEFKAAMINIFYNYVDHMNACM